MNIRLVVALFAASSGLQACDQSGEPIQAEAETSTAEAGADSVVIHLRPGEDHYQLARLDIGALAISLDTIAASGTGSIIRIQIGNTTAAGLEALSATLQWGPVAADGTPQTAPERTREAPLAAAVLPGKWTVATVTLADIPPREIRFLRLSNIDYTGIILK